VISAQSKGEKRMTPKQVVEFAKENGALMVDY
jgi:hypothetical protein